MKKSFQITQQHIDSFNKSQSSFKNPKSTQRSENFYSVTIQTKHRNTISSQQLPLQKVMVSQSSHKKNNKTTLSEIFQNSGLTQTRKSRYGQKLKSITQTSKELKQLSNPFLKAQSNPIFFEPQERKEKPKELVIKVDVEQNQPSADKRQSPFFLYSDVQEKRQKGRKQLYDNVKLVSGIAKEEEDQKIRNFEIIQLFMKKSKPSDQFSSPPSSKNESSPMSRSPTSKQKIYSRFRESVQAIKKIKRNTFKNQIDQELVQILISKWKNLNKKQMKAMKLKELASKKAKRQLQMKNERKKVIAQSLLEWLQQMNRCKITKSVLTKYNLNIFPSKSFEEEGSFYFLKCVKYNNMEQVKEMVASNRKFIYQFNHLRQNCLHICSKCGHSELLQELISLGADYEQLDYMKRSPLYYAVKYDHRDCFKILLYAGAHSIKMDSMCSYYEEILKQLRKVEGWLC